MRLDRPPRRPDKRAEFRLKLSVHFDACRAAPGRYFMVLWWRLQRKRVRARNHLVPLLGGARRAYEFWLLREGENLSGVAGTNVRLPILALVDARTSEGLERTLAILRAENIPALQVGGEALPTLADAAREIDWSARQWLMPIMPGDVVARGVAHGYGVAAESDCRIAYADDDLVDPAGRYFSPHFKPDWNSELYRHFDYLTGACVIRAERADLEALGDVADWAPRLIERALEPAGAMHVRRVLHHRSSRPAAIMPATPRPERSELPPVTVIVPTRNRIDLLRTCLSGVAATDYPDVEVIVVDNDSDDPETLAYLAEFEGPRRTVLRHHGPFNFSALNNRAAARASGTLLCLLNNDIEVIEPDWLATMAVQAERVDVGAVGAQLFFPDGRIQHAGVVIGMGNAAGHAHRFVHPDEEGYFRRHAVPQFVSAVTAACLVVKRERFLAVGGLNEKDFAVAYNDVDLCMRLNQKGWQSLYEPRAKLIHHESVSRGLDRDPVGAARLARELAALKARWDTESVVDPFHHPELSRASEQFVMRLWNS